jgi:site-specific DNA recombinase
VDRYACANHYRRSTCDNGCAVRREKIEARILDGFKGKLVTPTPRQRQFASFALSGIV